MRRSVVVLAATVLVAVAVAVVPAGAADRRPLRVAVSLPAPGFWDGRTAESGGFEADLALALADRLGFDGVRVVDTPFPRITRGRFAADLAISQVSITPARQRVVDFTGPYLVVDQAVVTGVPGPAGPDPAAWRWGAVRDTTGATTLRSEIRPSAPVTDLATESEAFAALRAGRIDAVMIDVPIATRAVADAGGALGIRSTVPTGERYGIVLARRSRLTTRATRTLAALVDDGTVARLAAAAGLPEGAVDPAFIT